MKPFQFTDDPPQSSPGILVLYVPRGLTDKASVLTWYSESLSLPDYFGWNWDAFDDCLRDLSWLKETGVLIVHGDIPLASSVAEQKAYLEILAGAVRSWNDDVSRRLMVIFPEAYRHALKSM